MVLGATFEKIAKVENRTTEQRFGHIFGSGGGLVGGSWGGFWEILATSWALLDDLGVKLGTSWQHVGNKMTYRLEGVSPNTSFRFYFL